MENKIVWGFEYSDVFPNGSSIKALTVRVWGRNNCFVNDRTVDIDGTDSIAGLIDGENHEMVGLGGALQAFDVTDAVERGTAAAGHEVRNAVAFDPLVIVVVAGKDELDVVFQKYFM